MVKLLDRPPGLKSMTSTVTLPSISSSYESSLRIAAVTPSTFMTREMNPLPLDESFNDEMVTIEGNSFSKTFMLRPYRSRSSYSDL